MPKLCRVTKVNVPFLFLVLVFNFEFFGRHFGGLLYLSHKFSVWCEL